MRRTTLTACLLLALAGCARTAEQEASRGLELAREGRIEQAVEAFDRALAKDPENLKALYNRGLAMLLLGDGPEAARSLGLFVQIRPDDMEGHFNLARAWALAGRNGEAIASLQRAVELGFSDHDLLIEGGGFQALYRDIRFVQLETVVAQRAGVLPSGGSLGRLEGPAYGGIPVDVRLPGTTGPRSTCDRPLAAADTGAGEGSDAACDPDE